MDTLPFFLYVIIMAITPRPNNLMSLAESSHLGLRRSVPFLYGLFVSFFILDIVALCLSKLLLDTLPDFEFIFKLLGSAYIIFLSFKLWTAPPSTEIKEISQRRLFLSGMFLNLSNIKVMLYFLMAYVSFLLPVYKDWAPILFFSIAMCLLASLCNVIWAAAGASLRRFLNKYEQQTNRILALLLLLSAIEIWL